MNFISIGIHRFWQNVLTFCQNLLKSVKLKLIFTRLFLSHSILFLVTIRSLHGTNRGKRTRNIWSRNKFLQHITYGHFIIIISHRQLGTEKVTNKLTTYYVFQNNKNNKKRSNYHIVSLQLIAALTLSLA